METSDDHRLVRPKEGLCSLLQMAGATKYVFTMKEVMFYLGQYIIQKQLYDQKQQHIVHCGHDALGRMLGVDSFSVKEPRVLFAMLTKNLVAVPVQELDGPTGSSQVEHSEEAGGRSSTPRRRRRRSLRSSSTGPSHRIEEDKEEDASEEDEEDKEGPKRRRSDSFSLTFDESLSWCVIGGLGGGGDRHSSQSSDSHSASGRSEVTAPPDPNSDSDNFSVEFEVESVESDDYCEDDESLSADDQVYEVTIFEGEDDDSFEDTEITEADYWRCDECDGLNPPLPRNCLRCWTPRQDWLQDTSCPIVLPPKPTDQSAVRDAAGYDAEDHEGVDVPDGKRAKSPALQSQCLSESQASSSSCCSRQEKMRTSGSQPSSSDSQEPLPLPLIDPPPLPVAPGDVPELERSMSAEWRLPDSCLDPCVICQSRPKNGCIVHGRTGHLMSCYVCARKLKKRNKLCPVCRLPIQSVVLTYLS
uniref:E3 ubiquitin-protein ligase Mdm2-like n=1 Tax=Doryrhamphus excisus TaxID=161450 RepID=UPI0025AE2B6A|nr:E3 ubiquitin-protein ligase Mdm2-like [Doryrhamphus excisus]XP_057941367.1 E3 ubiquitin-protein ligase Mdm2-like [Doryrhamphus excisus]XP_057941369.1 E3 ubiquitin-protein ligase Mdm2-like [Doryrhamphus excisus]XP_057941370.1 E3 ubiquitin-protein ligase Mdm2-like [Doryrhamphus excisus]XP_057941371.1 E3 ubiquitin-protein ligase Mdm2-like [Doryrhamphus excisus]XP_057941372.1 E3 ubiquitin-protein ligase Mdm2-like [Doryrhamphus excisus]XP_057941373.1 E3 ubiquitin-protein ligase Mdm2-like [Doryr